MMTQNNLPPWKKGKKKTNLCLTKRLYTIKMMDIFVSGLSLKQASGRRAALEIKCQVTFSCQAADSPCAIPKANNSTLTNM